MSRVFKVDYIPDPDRGRPLWNAKIYVGIPNEDPTIPSNQIQLTGDIGFPVGQSIPVPQPVRTNKGGVTVYNNSPLDLNAPGQQYAIAIYDRNDELIYNFPQVDGSVAMNTTSQEEVTGLTIWPEVGEAVIGQTIPAGTDAIRYPFNGRSTLFTLDPAVAVSGPITDITINTSGIGTLTVDGSDVYELQEFNSFIAANDGDSQLAGGAIWPLSSQDSLSLGAQSTVVDIDADRFRVNTGSEVELLYLWEPSGTLPAAPFTITNISTITMGAHLFTINGSDYEFTTRENRLERSVNRPEGWGAVGDGVNDDTAAIQAANDYRGVSLTNGNEYFHTGLNCTSLWECNGAQLTYGGTGEGIVLKTKGYLNDAVVRPQMTGMSRQVATDALSDMQIIGCDIRFGEINVYLDVITFGVTVNRNLIGDATASNVFGNQVKRCIISENYILGSSGWGIDIDAVDAEDPDQEHGVIINGNHIFGNNSGGIRHTGQSSIDKAQHCIIIGNHIDHNFNDNDNTEPSYGIFVKNTERPLITGNLIRSQTIMGIYLEECSVPVVSANEFWKSTVNPGLPDKAIEAVNSSRGQFVGNGRDSSDDVVGLDDWTIVDRFDVQSDILRARTNIYIDRFRMQWPGSGSNEGNVFVNHNSGFLNKRCEWQDGGDPQFTFKVIGTVEATVGFIPFTGKHIFWSKDFINTGMAVDIVEAFSNTSQGQPQGEVSISSVAMSKVCCGVVEYCGKMSDHEEQARDDGYLVMVAAVGDNRTDRLEGFIVNSEGGEIEPGDILCTSSTSGELMKCPEDALISVTKFKCMGKPKDKVCYGYFIG